MKWSKKDVSLNLFPKLSLSRWVSWFRATSWRSLLETAVSNLESVREKIGSNSSSIRLATPGLQDDDHWNMGILSYIFPKALLVHTFLFILAIRSQPFVRSSQSIAFWSFLKLSFYLYMVLSLPVRCWMLLSGNPALTNSVSIIRRRVKCRGTSPTLSKPVLVDRIEIHAEVACT